ncbi:helix-turn-helix domain-containing protein [Amycolatopsis rhizosphaerae]|uniref:Helix-turn-helix domain-containing protein n=1 Tax=Amycolatopsis rhizosphaerae TaxID=2053003 RepID=A0A558B2X3_9PSEU|nr:helix-turn-helix domain-containing protein [Amycolatopsis rhizosphaerae]TVT30857.1 helix-turn-helix domain-containing protein [Amycolatopsis rhizosphaerae]
MHRIAVIAVPPVTTFDLSIPGLVFGVVATVQDAPGYEVVLCTADPGRVPGAGGMDIVIGRGLDAVDGADTVMVTGTGATVVDVRVLTALRSAASAGKRVAAICTGAFVLAEAGLLDGRDATTYWARSAELARRFPAVNVQPDVLYVQDGNILTSAGLAAGIDLCLHMVRTDYGAAVANTVARYVVVAPVRPGGQAQFIESPLPPERGTSLAATREWARQRLQEQLTLTDLAAHANISVRSLTRRFHSETGLSPLQWLLHQRIDRARELLETTTLPMDQIARLSGIGTSESLRQHLVRRVGLTPSAYRATFRQTPAS